MLQGAYKISKAQMRSTLICHLDKNIYIYFFFFIKKEKSRERMTFGKLYRFLKLSTWYGMTFCPVVVRIFV